MTHQARSPRIWKSEAIREVFLDYFPGMTAHHREVNKEAVTTSAWLVTLTTGFLAFLLARPALFLGANDELRRLMLLLAVGTVGIGVLFRVFSGLLDRRLGEQSRDLAFRLIAAGQPVLDPSETEIVPNMERLEEAHVELTGRPIAAAEGRGNYPAAIKHYAKMFEIYTNREREDIRHLELILGAVEGRNAEESRGLISENTSGDAFDDLRAHARSIAYWTRGVSQLFTFQLWLFFGMMAAIGAMLW